jgi:hypothetical protein
MIRLFDEYPEAKRTEMFDTLRKYSCPMINSLRLSEQQDILEGRCIYREYEGQPILDYTP